MIIRRARTPTETGRVREAVKAVGRKVRALRAAKGWTLEQASEVIDLDPRHLQRIETGAVSPSATTLLRIADSLRVPVGVLFDTVAPLEEESMGEPVAQSPPTDVDVVPLRVGQRIATLRRERGQTQAQLAADASLTEQYVQRVEGGHQNPSIKVLVQIARAFGVSVSDLVRVADM